MRAVSTCCLLHAGLVGPYLAGALSKNGTDYSTPLITLGAFVLVAAIMLFGEPQQTHVNMRGHENCLCCMLRHSLPMP